MMSANVDETAVVRYALETTCATTICPFHDEVIIRAGDDAAESHAYERAKRVATGRALREEIDRQLAVAADGRCPKCDPTASGH
ncbi:hypothetical protein N2603_36470 [Bradyrhizobium huanghuaihaiense]|uniref:hypothetical protein n=1 Tax=Bradyrhizobium huanghuaihaiense TaxID=990078 RepID=UPI0021A99A8D|nr:hypothetical protein [Bradyrhizobium sp. CB3035]UWU75468.1 hypothetical protein N2603_36470 [Bradyrhizobium sp. CB3035]